MKILKKENARRYIRKEGIKSYLLASSITSDSKLLTTTLVEIEPGGKQRIHRHDPEQIYFFLQGSGVMTVGGESQMVIKGDCVFIPANEPHGLENNGNTRIIYFSAAAPSFSKEDLLNFWPLTSEGESS